MFFQPLRGWDEELELEIQEVDDQLRGWLRRPRRMSKMHHKPSVRCVSRTLQTLASRPSPPALHSTGLLTSTTSCSCSSLSSKPRLRKVANMRVFSFETSATTFFTPHVLATSRQ